MYSLRNKFILAYFPLTYIADVVNTITNTVITNSFSRACFFLIARCYITVKILTLFGSNDYIFP